VRHRIGVWRRKSLHINFAGTSSLPKSNKTVHDYALPVHLSGWGSNDEGQLKHSSTTSMETYVTDISNEIPSIFRTEKVRLKKHITNRPQWEDIEDFQVVAGGSSSAFLHDNVIAVWGKLASDIVKKHANPTIENDYNILTIVIEHVIGAAIGHSHILLLLEDGIVVGLGENSSNQCDCPVSIGLMTGEFCLELVETPDEMNLFRIKYLKDVTKSALKYKVAKLSAGIHHSAAITACGGLITWGEDKYGQSFANVVGDFIWYPESSHLIDISCGGKQTFVVDDCGRIFSMGCNKYGSLGRRIVSDDRKCIDRSMRELVFPCDIRFQRVRYLDFS
jgi:alpha-tubulin suppressor-like RCC1 family protein